MFVTINIAVCHGPKELNQPHAIESKRAQKEHELEDIMFTNSVCLTRKKERTKQHTFYTSIGAVI